MEERAGFRRWYLPVRDRLCGVGTGQNTHLRRGYFFVPVPLFPRVLYNTFGTCLTAVSFVFAFAFVFHCPLSIVGLLVLEDVIKIRYVTR